MNASAATPQINFVDMVRTLAKPGEAIISTLTPLKAHLWHMASCQLGEVGELIDALINDDRVNVVEEFGDIEFYMEGIRGALGIPHAMHNFSDSEADPSIIVESGNVFDVIKGHVIYNKKLDFDAVVNALARFEGAMHKMRQSQNITREETINGNIAKLGKRYAGMKYSDQAAAMRADKVAEETEHDFHRDGPTSESHVAG